MQTFQSSGMNKHKDQVSANESMKQGSIRAGGDRAGNKEPVSNYSHINYQTSSKGLTLKQLKDTIEEIYDSKLKFD